MESVSFFWITYALLWILTASLAVAVLALFRVHGTMLMAGREARLQQGPEVGKPVSVVSMSSTSGMPVTLGRSAKPAAQVVFFASIRCKSCLEARHGLSAFATTHASAVETIVVCDGTLEEARKFSSELSEHVQVVPDGRLGLAARWRVRGAPFIVVLDPNGNVRGAMPGQSLDGLSELALGTSPARLAEGPKPTGKANLKSVENPRAGVL
jgi:hypothetical protein